MLRVFLLALCIGFAACGQVLAQGVTFQANTVITLCDSGIQTFYPGNNPMVQLNSAVNGGEAQTIAGQNYGPVSGNINYIFWNYFDPFSASAPTGQPFPGGTSLVYCEPDNGNAPDYFDINTVAPGGADDAVLVARRAKKPSGPGVRFVRVPESQWTPQIRELQQKMSALRNNLPKKP